MIFIPPRKGTAIPIGRNAPGPNPAFKKGEFFLRANDRKKRAQTNAELSFLWSPAEPEVVVGSHQLRSVSPRSGVKLFVGDYKEFIGKETREPKIAATIDALIYGKWDIVLLRGVGGVGKTAVAIEVTHRLANEYQEYFGGIISMSGKTEELTPYERRGIKPEIASYEEFLRQFLINTEWEGDMPDGVAAKQALVKDLTMRRNILLFIDNYETIESYESRISDFLRNLPSGVKTLLTARHQPKDLPTLPIDIPVLAKTEAQALAYSEADAQRIGIATIERHLDQILEISSCIPLAIKWIISCSKNADHLKQLIDEHRRGNPALANLCEFCFTFEYNLLPPAAKTALALFPLFHSAPTAREVAVAADMEADVISSALDELVDYNLIMRERSPASGEEIYRILELTASFATTKLRAFPDLERQARRRLKQYYGASIPVLITAAHEMISRRAYATAREYIEEEILDRDPENATAYFLRAQTFEKELNYIEALKDFETALEKARSDRDLCAEAALQILSLRRTDPQYSREAMIPILDRAHGASKDVRLAAEIAKIYEMQGQTEPALEYYMKVFKSYSAHCQGIWEDAALFVALHRQRTQGSEQSLKFVREALAICPGSKRLARFEQELMMEVGEIHIRTRRLPTAPKSPGEGS